MLKDLLNSEGKPLGMHQGMQDRHRARKDTNAGVFSCSTCAAGCDTNDGVSSCSACIGGCRKDTEHEKTPMMASPCVRRVSLGVEKTPSTKRHQQWCLLVFGMHRWV